MPARTCMRIQNATAHAECEPLLHTSTRGPRDPTPRTRQAGPPTTLAPATWTNARSGLQFPLHLRRGSTLTGLPSQVPARSSAAGPHIPMLGATGTFFSPQTPPSLGDDRASTRLFSWDARRHSAAQVPPRVESWGRPVLGLRLGHCRGLSFWGMFASCLWKS